MRLVATRMLIIDDISGETGARTRRLSLDGVDYEIDLTDASFAELRRLLKPYLRAARTTQRTPGQTARGIPAAGRPARRKGAAASESATIRAWARATGLDAPQRGRIPASLREAWQAAGSPR